MSIIFQPTRQTFRSETIQDTLTRWTEHGVILSGTSTVCHLRYNEQGDSRVIKTTDLFEFLMGE